MGKYAFRSRIAVSGTRGSNGLAMIRGNSRTHQSIITASQPTLARVFPASTASIIIIAASSAVYPNIE
eukprot:CAMPEP_0204822652 /NCGR_PEP_ID=MMETSP1346-20131115/848_1 /ASSEMBLY_ACC=CAM_ASM_000771 /TAXON_ID=215587 /ORGANISM="Aplanochytrium stocchinoi, Strain GSBS06" /LENGTH=67 /DNA_ID=CAMNT_0051948989 /DNA_START=1311 /DNA_END=1514 /DNA_ORIENTATION=-